MGFLVNPVAGLGGRPGFKGSDDAAKVAPLLKATEFDDLPANQRALDFLTDLALPNGVAVTGPGPLGEVVLKKSMICGGPIFEVVREPGWAKPIGETTADDTKRFARRMLKEDLDLLVIVGGDGTAVDVARTVETKVPLLGVPAGVKMFSGLFAETPAVAKRIVQALAAGFATRPVDVVDLDESSYATGQWVVRGLAEAVVPEAPGVQVTKGGDAPREQESLQDLVAWFREAYRPDTAYVIGAGTTTAAIKRSLGGGTPLGVDVYRDGAFVATDAGEAELLHVLHGAQERVLLLSPTAQQGCLLGRGTAQISPAVLEFIDIHRLVVLSTPGKLMGLRELFVDTGDPELDARFPDYVKIRTDPLTEKVFKLRKGVVDGRG